MPWLRSTASCCETIGWSSVEFLLQLLHRTSASHEDFQHSDSRGMSECTEELRLEHLKLTGSERLAAPLPLPRH